VQHEIDRLELAGYEQQQRRLNARSGLLVLALLPLPAILIGVGLSALRMLMIIVSWGGGVGILFPIWWRTKYHPFRDSAVERRTRRIAWVCVPAAFLSAVVAMLFWSVGTRAAEWIGAVFGIAAVFLLWFSFSSDQKAKHSL
jgi:hypothetical protein